MIKALSNIAGKATVLASKVKFKAIDKAPELYFVAGVGFLIAMVPLTYKRSLKFQEVLKKHNQDLKDQEDAANIADTIDVKDEYPIADRKADRRSIYINTAVETVKTWTPVFICGSLSVLCFGKSFGILQGRYLAAASMAASLTKENRWLKSRIKEELGEEAYDKITGPKTEKQVDPETGEFKDVPANVDEDEYSDLRWGFQRFFDESNTNWSKSSEGNKFFLRGKEKWADKMLKERGFLFINEVYEMLEFPENEWSDAGQIYGWKYYKDPNEAKFHHAANYVSFGLLKETTQHRAFINGSEPSILLEFNVDPEPIIGMTNFRK